MLAGAFFYLFAGLTLFSGLMVISVRNPVHAVIFLITAFFGAAGLFVLLGAEFLAMLLVIVYVGAVAVLFLFVVMMLDVDFDELRAGFARYLPLGALVGLVLLGELVAVAYGWDLSAARGHIGEKIPAADQHVTNTAALGRVLYTKYAYFFEIAGLILLVAMIGAIVLTLRQRVSVRRQNVSVQVSRGPKTSLVICRPETGKGLETI
jgi:NADH-quinone oxidoreductase subunit J